MTNSNVIKSVVPAIASAIYRAKLTQSPMAPQTCAIAALALFRMMDSFVRTDVVPAVALVGLATTSIESANRHNNDLKSYHYTDSPVHLIGLAKHLGFVVVDEDQSFTMTERWVELVSTKETCTPFVEPVTEETRRKPYIKGGKRKPSRLMKESVQFLQDTQYHVDGPMVAIINGMLESMKTVPDAIEQELHVWYAARNSVDKEVLYSDYFADNRGRLYHVACAGPNPQSSDFARSLYSHNVANIVEKDTPAYEMFMNELYDIAGGDWNTDAFIMRTAKNPVGALKHMLTSGNSPKKPFTYVRLALDWYQFETTGACDSRVGFGLDAKCSGTQYLAMIAGNKEMASACGVTNSPDKTPDPYQLSLRQLISGLMKSSLGLSEAVRETYFNPKAGRNFIKTPYMAIQYGGGIAALTGNKDFVTLVTEIYGEGREELFSEITVAAIKRALGDKINNFIEKTAEAVRSACEKSGKVYLDYRHTDGQIVHKPCYPSMEICDAFSIRIDSKTRVIFGNINEGTPWKIRATEPTLDEFVRTFVVNFIQGIDALVARTVAKYAKKAGLRGFTSIHDCFRCCLEDAPKMMEVIREAYIEVFVKNNQFENLSKQIGGINMYHENIITEELLRSEHAYYFCQ